jgi:hypothetical protein
MTIANILLCSYWALLFVVVAADPDRLILPVSRCADLCDRSLTSPVVSAVLLTGNIANFRCSTSATWQVCCSRFSYQRQTKNRIQAVAKVVDKFQIGIHEDNGPKNTHQLPSECKNKKSKENAIFSGDTAITLPKLQVKVKTE